MEVKNIVVCDEIINHPGPNGVVPCLMMPYTNINLPIIPTTFSFSVFTMIDGFPEEPGGFKLNIYPEANPSKIINSTDVPVDYGNLKAVSESKNPSMSFAMSIRNLLFEEEGKYVIDILYNDKKIATQTIGFYKAEGEVK